MKISEALKCIISGYHEHGKRLSHSTYYHKFNPYRICFAGGGFEIFLLRVFFLFLSFDCLKPVVGIVLSIVTSYGLDNRRIVVRFTRVVKRFVFPLK